MPERAVSSPTAVIRTRKLLLPEFTVPAITGADKLEAVLGDPELARSVGERGRDEVHRTLDVNESATQLIAHIER